MYQHAATKGYLLNLKRKALNIRKRSATTKTKKKDERYITIPNSKTAVTIAKELETTGFKVAFTSGKKVGDMTTKSREQKGNDNSVVYQVPCGSCDKNILVRLVGGQNKAEGAQTRLTKRHGA